MDIDEINLEAEVEAMLAQLLRLPSGTAPGASQSDQILYDRVKKLAMGGLALERNR